jgi:hypothetical protein
LSKIISHKIGGKWKEINTFLDKLKKSRAHWGALRLNGLNIDTPINVTARGSCGGDFA